MGRFKLKVGLGFIPFLGFLIILFWGMFSVYAVNHKRIQVLQYDLACMAGIIIVFVPMGLGIYFFIQNVDPTNKSLVIGVLLSICLVGLYLITAVCLAIQYLYCKKLFARQNTQYLS